MNAQTAARTIGSRVQKWLCIVC